ncbi:MAG: class I SAM-dependent methyltransferase [Magnetococcales bacterium]|nr:class I SAM-dependent methyltransferase [Magnetococcales bacterium]
MGIKLNLGASPRWIQEGWHVLDHKLTESTGIAIAGDATNIQLPDDSCDIVFCSHVVEHIPHIRFPIVLSEINRVLRPGGILRILTPNLEVIARAYVEKDDEFFQRALEEDESLRKDLGYGGMLVNYIVSPGQDTVLLDRNLKNFIAGYAHLYAYDYSMLEIILKKLGFTARKAEFNDSEFEEVRVPLHVLGLEPVWQNFNQAFYARNGLVHKLVDGVYDINFKVTGFDRDPLTSLIVEAKKAYHVDKQTANATINESLDNYNRYAWSLLRSPEFVEGLERMNVSYKVK